MTCLVLDQLILEDASLGHNVFFCGTSIVLVEYITSKISINEMSLSTSVLRRYTAQQNEAFFGFY